MYHKKAIIDLYNKISEEKINQDELSIILPKLYLIMNKIEMDEVEIIMVIDTLREINNLNQIEKITPEIIDLIIKITKNDKINLEGTLYFSIILKHVILPYSLNKCNQDYNLMMYLSEFELLIELINKMLNKKDLIILDKYNHELTEIIKKYKEVMAIYKKYVINDVILNTMISHFSSMLYFNLDDYDKKYDLLMEIVINIINNYQPFIDYCCSYGIHKNFTRINTDLKGIEMEYIISNDMLKYLYNNNEKGKIKRK